MVRPQPRGEEKGGREHGYITTPSSPLRPSSLVLNLHSGSWVSAKVQCIESFVVCRYPLRFAIMSVFSDLSVKVSQWMAETSQLVSHIHARQAELEPKVVARNQCPSDSSSETTRAPSVRHGMKRMLSKESLYETCKRRRLDEEDDSDSESADEEVSIEMRPVVQYDGYIQKTLEKMVQSIWSARRKIRVARVEGTTESTHKTTKDKTSQTSDHKPSMSVEVDTVSSGGSATESASPAKSTRSPQRKKCPFEFIEGRLGVAQELCETAAFRDLRQGSCIDELDELLQTFELIQEAATNMAEKHAEAQKEQQASEEKENKTSDHTAPSDPSGLATTCTGVIEVDDNTDASEVSINITALRTSRRLHQMMRPMPIAQVG